MNIYDEEQQLIINALESLATSYSNDALSSLIEKYNTIIEKREDKNFLGFQCHKGKLQSTEDE
ncbi:hypothetical protein HMPREF9466_01738 [Fusobacterium necrophorum subsp. funduliforme 1_1_36S]|nr:hypothetical protein HMPREF9466_01738 [Fusobacterium necrophorum subsp. funduliforme 1_1_36S]